ncbi:MAG: ribose-phosphate pyrophosphokinase-like domain-containing protein, partial [Planctomycetes bacterium]|nr:ribose-phosphate pyrophosphokinase-like domain-containing protein [Planctomycetota bacterium]
MNGRRDRLRIFTGNAHPRLAKDICAHLGVPLGDAKCRRFPDGEIDLKVDCDVRGADVFVIQPTCPPVDTNLMELLVFIDCLRRSSADRITAVMPYFGY